MERLGLGAVYSRLVAGSFSEQTSGCRGVCKPSGRLPIFTHTHTRPPNLWRGDARVTAVGRRSGAQICISKPCF